jgi:thioredoxin 1
MDITSVSEFDEIIKDGKTVLVDFWAPWCGPCRMLTPAIDKLSDNYPGNVYKVNVDTHSELASRFGVRGIPNVKLFKGGEVQETIQGVNPPSLYESKLKYYLG